MASFWAKVAAFPQMVRKAWTNQDAIAELSDKVVVARAASDAGDAEPKKIVARAVHAGMIYNPSYSSVYGEETYTPQEYNMAVVANCIDTDSYFRRAVEKYVELILKSGFKFVGKNTRAVTYLRMRYEQIGLATGIPTMELFRQIAYQLVTYGNVYISKVRDDKASGGNYRRAFNNQLLAPVAGYFVEDTIAMNLAFKENGDPIGYKQMIPGSSKFKIWRPWNMIHMYYSKKPGLRVGTPLVWPVLDDLRALRKMEQNVELLVFQHTIPLYHYKVGTETKPAQDIEITTTKSTVEKMPPNGCIVTPERHTIEAIGAENNALDVSTYLEYFKSRVLSGLGMSAVAMGEGNTASKASALVVDKHMHNTTETFQQILKMFINDYMNKELLLEGGYTFDASDEDNKVELYFPPVDKEGQFAKENHYSQLYAQHAIKESELREELGRDKIEDTEEDRGDMYLTRVALALALVNSKDETLSQYPEAVKTVTKKSETGNTVTKVTTKLPAANPPAANQGMNRARPANQYGRPLAAPRAPKNDTLYRNLLSVYDATKDDVIQAYQDYASHDEYAPLSLGKVKKSVFDLSKKRIDTILTEREDIIDKGYLNERTRQILDEVFEKITPVFDTKNQCDAVAKIGAIFDVSKYRMTSFFDVCVPEETP